MKTQNKIRSLSKTQIIWGMIILTLASVLVLVINPAARKGPFGFGPPASMTTFQMKDGSFSISYPQNWTAAETPQGSHGDTDVVAMIIVAGRQMANVTIARQTFSDGDIKNVIDWGQSRAEKKSGYTSLSLNPITDSQTSDYIRNYTWLSSGLFGTITSRCQDIYLIDQNNGYVLAFCSQDKDWKSLEPFFIEMQQSFAFK